MKKIVLIFTSVLVVLSVATAAQAQEPLRFGSVAMDIPAVMHKRLKPLTRYLSDELGQPVELILSPDMKSAIDAVANGNVDFAYLTPVAYLKSRRKSKTQLVAKTVTNGKASFKLMVVTASNNQITSISDLKGKRFAFGDRAALLQRAIVVGAGLPMSSLGKISFLGHYDNIVRGVLVGDHDAGILKDTMAYQWENKGVRIVHSSPDLPPYNITASSKVSPDLLAKLQRAFLRLDSKNPTHNKFIKALDKKYDGFAKTSDAEYDVIRKLILPFDK
ncbi:MAG: PhnD/SsuA/transferrin family substrate-binding protein [Gammaproteobacteria bacterium]|nr:PhnD/SsuA/transferrin family substrate-binding protein [Gammaproteobacteria bacterium]